MKFEEISVGMKANLEHKITQSDLDRFVDLTGDNNKLHTDLKYSARTSFKKPVAHGMLGASFISTIIGTKIPGDGALWFSQEIEFLFPVRIGDVLNVTAEVVKTDKKSKIIELQTDIYNQHKKKILKGYAKVKVIEQEAEIIEEEVKIQKVALIIGATGGIGSSVAKTLASDGFDVALHYYSRSDLANQLAEEIASSGVRAFVYGCDVKDEKGVREMVESALRDLGNISVVVNCSTSNIAAIDFNNLSWTDFTDHLDNQIKGNFNLVKAVLPQMAQNKFGKIIFINSQYLENPSPNLLPYITGKGALMGFQKALALDLSSKGILVNSVSPGMTNTEQLADIPERIRMVAAAKAPLKRIANPQDVANCVSFLASERSNYLCGETIRVNGGQVMI